MESERLNENLGDHRGAFGRIIWAIMTISISFGIAGILVAIFAMKNSIRWIQPAVPVGLAIFIPISWNALSEWIGVLEGTTSLFMITLGVLALSSAISCVVTNKQQWISSGLWVGHLLIPSGAFLLYEQTSVLMMILILAVSTTVVAYRRYYSAKRLEGIRCCRPNFSMDCCRNLDVSRWNFSDAAGDVNFNGCTLRTRYLVRTRV